MFIYLSVRESLNNLTSCVILHAVLDDNELAVLHVLANCWSCCLWSLDAYRNNLNDFNLGNFNLTNVLTSLEEHVNVIVCAFNC